MMGGDTYTKWEDVGVVVGVTTISPSYPTAVTGSISRFFSPPDQG